MLLNKTILIVDDDKMVLDTLAEMVPSDIKVVRAATEDEALKIIQNSELDAVLCDITLTKGNGLKLLEKCRNRKLNVPFVMITGDVTKENALLALRLGASDVIEKPISMTYFDNEFQKVVEEGHSLLRIKHGVGQVGSLVGSTKAGEIDFVKDYLAMVEANRLMKKTG